MRTWWHQQRQLWRAAGCLAKRRAIVLMGWWFASGFAIATGWVLWHLLVTQLDVAGLVVPGMAWRLACVWLFAEYMLVVLTLLLGQSKLAPLMLEEALQTALGMMGQWLALRVIALLLMAVGLVCCVLPGVLCWLFASAINVDLLQGAVAGEPAVQRAVAWTRGHFWRVIRACGAWHVWVLCVFSGGVWWARHHVGQSSVGLWMMVWLAHVVWLRCLQVVTVERLLDEGLEPAEDLTEAVLIA